MAQHADAIEDIRRDSSAQSNVAFQTYCGAMEEELIETCHEFEGHDDTDLEMCDAWKERSKALPKPERTVANRSQMTSAVAKLDTCFWHMDLFEAEPWLWSALEAGGTLDAYYGYAGDMEPCDQPLRIKSGKLLVRKLAAMRNAVTALAAHGTGPGYTG